MVTKTVTIQVWEKECCGEGLKGPRGHLDETALPLKLHKVAPFSIVCFPLLVGLMLTA